MGKLLKYDLRSMLKTFIPLWGAFLAISILVTVSNLITQNGNFELPFFEALVMIVPAVLYSGMIIAISVVTLIFIIQRFYNGLLRDEGYLMFTLPVKTWHLVAAKGLSAGIVVVLSGIIGVISIFILGAPAGFFREIIFFAQGLPIEVSGIPLKALLVFESIIVLILNMFSAVYMIYAAMAIGHLAKKNRVAWSFVAYVGIAIVMSVMGSIFAFISLPGFALDVAVGVFPEGVMASQLSAIIVILMVAIKLAVFFLVTERILSLRLNLE